MRAVSKAVVAALALACAAGVSYPAAAQSGGVYERPSAAAPAAADALAVLDVIARMNGAIDTEDYALYARFFTEDGEIDSGFGPPVRGRDAIVRSLEASAPFITNKRHSASNIVLNQMADGLVATYYLTVLERRSALAIAGTAVITDTFRKEGDRWFVVRHVTRMDPATLAAMQAAPR